MFGFLLKDRVIKAITKTISEEITKDINTSLSHFSKEQDLKLNTIINHLESLRIELSTVEARLNQKEIQDKMEYGQMHYKINSLR